MANDPRRDPAMPAALANAASDLVATSRQYEGAAKEPLTPVPGRFKDPEGMKSSDTRPALLIDSQAHVFWGEDHVNKLSEPGAAMMEGVCGFVAAYHGREGKMRMPDLNRAMFLEDVFLHSETDVVALNAFGMQGNWDGVDLFSPREAAFIKSMLPNRMLVIGTVDPPDGQKAIESVDYQCGTLKVDGIKLYPKGPLEPRAWLMDDEKITYPLYDMMQKRGVKAVFCHKGLPGKSFDPDACRVHDLVRAAKDFPNMNFVVYHCAFPFDEEAYNIIAESGAKNVYVELGAVVPLAVHPKGVERFAMMLGRFLKSPGPDRILFGTDTPVAGRPQFQINAFREFQIPVDMQEKYGFPALTPEIKRKILGENAARMWGIDPATRLKEIKGDVVTKLRVPEDDRLLLNLIEKAIPFSYEPSLLD